MEYGTTDFDNILDEITEQVELLKNEWCIYYIPHNERVIAYNKLVTALLTLKEIS